MNLSVNSATVHRAGALLRLAADVEREDPSLARELRGMALHESAARAPQAPPAPGAWQRAAHAVWEALQAVGHRRAEREIAQLLKQWDITRPDVARTLRASLRRGD